MTYYVYSTLTCDNAYTLYKPLLNAGSVPDIERAILIKGGHGIANKYIQTPRGVVTEISDEEYNLLKDDFHFNEHVQNGFLQVENKQVETEKVVSDLEQRDASAPVIPEDYVEEKDREGNIRKVYKPKGKKA